MTRTINALPLTQAERDLQRKNLALLECEILLRESIVSYQGNGLRISATEAGDFGRILDEVRAALHMPAWELHADDEQDHGSMTAGERNGELNRR